MNDFKFLIRFGAHKDRETIKSLRESISGMVIPAHILCYSTNATIAAISYIRKGYYIDPMTYLYVGSDIADYIVLDDRNRKSFKPSIAKLTAAYGLTELFEKRGYAPLTPEDFTEDFIEEFCQKNIALQTSKVDEEKAGAYKKYSDLLKQVGENHIVEELEAAHSPAAIIPPYFFMDGIESEWLEVNKKLAYKTRDLTELPVMPLLLVHPSLLQKGLLDHFKDFKDLFLWVDAFEQKQSISGPQEAAYKNCATFIRTAAEREFKIINMRGTYFSILLGKVGLDGFCNGVFYGESKARKAAIGGVPPVRYYIRKLHEFFGIAESISLLKKYPDMLDKECANCLSLIKSNVDNIFAFGSQPDLAQQHFIYAREAEIEDAKGKTLEVLLQDLQTTYEQYRVLPDDITTKNIEYLRIWREALTP